MAANGTDEFTPCPRHGTHCFPEFGDDLPERIECAIGLGDSGSAAVKATRDRIMMMIEDHVAAETEALLRGRDECHISYGTWGEFFEAEEDNEPNYNLVFRWDWKKPETGVMGTLTVFWVGQRKALLRSTSVAVHPDEEPLVRAFLQPRLDYLMKLWAPLVPGTDGTVDGAD